MDEKIIVILGPTASGKTKLAAKLASEFNGEIISADSRQVYKGMDIGTGKDFEDYIVNDNKIRYHLIDIIDPTEEFNLYQFKKYFIRIFDEIVQRKKQAFLVGGSGLYLSSVIQNYELKEAENNENDIFKLSEMNIDELKEILFGLRANNHNTTDLIDKDRTIKAILAAKAEKNILNKKFISVVIGIKLEKDEIKTRISQRLEKRLKSGMIEEVTKLINSGVSLQKLLFFGLEYKFIALYLRNELSYDEMFMKLNQAINKFAKRQATWFRKMEKEGIKINWIDGGDYEQARSIILKLL